MGGLVTWYDILGILPGASIDTIRRAYEDRARQLGPQMISGATSKVIKAADRARAAADEAWRVLGEPVARERYDIEAGLQVVGSGLERPQPISSEPEWDLPGWDTADADIALAVVADWLGPHPAPARRVVVPDIRGLFVGPALRAVGDLGLHMKTIQLTGHPQPVEGLVVEQSPLPGSKVRRSAAVTAQIWHPASVR